MKDELKDLKAKIYDMEKELNKYYEQDKERHKSLIQKYHDDIDRINRGEVCAQRYWSYLKSVILVDSLDNFTEFNVDSTICHDVTDLEFPRIQLTFAMGQIINVVQYIKYSKESMDYYIAQLDGEVGVMPAVLEM